MQYWSDTEIALLRELWPTTPAAEIALRLNRTRKAVLRKAESMDLRIVTRPSRALYTVNSGCFTNLSPETAYLLGYTLADGTIGKRVFSISSTDRDMLVKLSTVLASTHPIYCFQRAGRKPCYRFDISSPPLIRALRDLGVTPCKSLTARMPAIPDHLFGHFLRGYFDGNGSVRFNNCLEITIASGSPALLDDLATYIAHRLNQPPARIYHHKSPRLRNVHVLRFWGPKAWQVEKLMYQDAGDLYMTRKRAIIDQISSLASRR